ncbi:hypothetical protein [Escherichia coli IS1]|nr:hypothetical protein [Escherichia coli IS1]
MLCFFLDIHMSYGRYQYQCKNYIQYHRSMFGLCLFLIL